jgi:hypothetical protein
MLTTVMAAGCATSSSRLGYRKLYPGPVRGNNEISVISNDPASGVYLGDARQGTKAIGVLPGTHYLTFRYYETIASGSGYHFYRKSNSPFVLNATVEAGHEYQVVGFVSSYLRAFAGGDGPNPLDIGHSFSAMLVDVTTPADVWDYYEREFGEKHKVLAVGRISDQARLQEIARSSPKPIVRQAAVRKVTDAKFLEAILAEEIDASVRTEAKSRLQTLTLRPGS